MDTTRFDWRLRRGVEASAAGASHRITLVLYRKRTARRFRLASTSGDRFRYSRQKEAAADRRSTPALGNGWAALSAERQPRRSRRTLSARGRRPWAGVLVCHTAPRSTPAPAGASLGWLLSRPACSASVALLRSPHYLNGETLLRSQLNRNNDHEQVFVI